MVPGAIGAVVEPVSKSGSKKKAQVKEQDPEEGFGVE